MPEPDTISLTLSADPTAVGEAREWLRAGLEEWSSDALATVLLLLTEVVTNAILHTEDVVGVTAHREGPCVTVEVSDRNPSKPVVKTYGRDAATGRGLHLVEALADGWGIRGDERHKTVWFRVIDAARSPALPGGDASQGWLEVDAWEGSVTAPAGPPPGPPGRAQMTVELSGLPVAAYLAAEEHHDALLREFALLRRPSDASRDDKMPGRLLELVATLVGQFGVGNEQRRAQVEAARRANQATVDVAMLFPLGSQDQVSDVAAQLDEVDGFCERGELLTRPSTPVVKRFRRWYTAEVVRQLDGRAPSPWPYQIDGSPGTTATADDGQR